MFKVTVLFVLLICAWWGFQSLERRSLYFPDHIIVAKPTVYRLAYEEVSVVTSDGKKIYGWYIPGTKPLTLLLSHGNAGNISNRLDKALLIHKTGAGLLMFDYRGYGQSEGVPSEEGTYRDAEAMYLWLTQTKKISQEQVTFYGESLGCAVATEMAIRHPAAGLILESPFTSTVAMAKRIFPWLPVKWIVRFRYDNLSKISKIHVPLLILHSPQDEIVPFEMGQQLYRAAPDPKRFFELTGGHNDGYEMTGEPYVRAIEDFLNSKKQSVMKETLPANDPYVLEAHVRKLSEEFVPRDYRHLDNLNRAADYVRNMLTTAGGRIDEQPFFIAEWNQKNQQVRLGPYRNVIASFGPEEGERIIIGAHYDAYGPYPGADDNASGVAVLLELARALSLHPPAIRTDLVAYTSEEPPWFGTDQMGSAIHAAGLNAAKAKVRYMISLEMLGTFSDANGSQQYPLALMRLFYPSKGNFIAVVGRLGQAGLCRRIKKMMRSASPLPVCWSSAPAWVPGIDFSDHRNYWRYSFPAVMITDTAFCRNINYHKVNDTADKLDYHRMAMVGDGVLSVIQGEK